MTGLGENNKGLRGSLQPPNRLKKKRRNIHRRNTPRNTATGKREKHNETLRSMKGDEEEFNKIFGYLLK